MHGFTLGFEGFDPADEGLQEALSSSGNGYLCTRGSAAWEDRGGVHCPGIYPRGGYNRETTSDVAALAGGRLAALKD